MNCQFLSILIFIASFNLFAQNKKLDIKLDSIEILRELSKDSNLEMSSRLAYAKKAVQLSMETDIDSTILRSNRDLSFIYLNLGEYDFVKSINFNNLKLASKLNDSLALAIANQNLGWYYEIELQQDSSYYYYYNAVKLYNKLKNVQNEGQVLLNMAAIQENEKDYIGSEVNAVRAIELIQALPETDSNLDTLWSIYNLLGVISEKLEQFDKAIEYHERALAFSGKIPDNYLYNLYTNTNMGTVYSKKRDYKKSLEYFNKILQDRTLIETDPSTYAYTIDNIAYTRFLSKDKDVSGIEGLFKQAFKIGDSIEDPIIMMSASSNIAELYFENNQKDSALFYAEKAYKISKETNSNDFVSKSLLLLSKINEGELGKNYLYERIKLNDSLLKNERAIRNKFARIEFETDQIEAENIKISRERLIFLLISVVLLLTLTSLYIIITQRTKNRKLRFAQKQQEANEEIYNLMLGQQDKIDEGRAQEKKRISEELHDGILGRLFGTRLSLDSLNMLQTDDAIKNREGYIGELKTIEEEIRKISHDLNSDFVAGSSFMDIVKTLIETQTQAYQLTYSFKEDDGINWDDVSNITKIHIYRMFQETMQNIYKHANANHIKISFQLKNNVILLSVEDDGSGFNVTKAKKGIGIKNINSRVKEIGGKVDIDSKVDVGTKIIISVPISNR